MAFNVEAIVGASSISLTDGAPFKLRHARGMAGPPVRRVTTRGPAQHGDTDLGYRLQPREIELELLFHADTDAVLDGYRDTLTDLFKPLAATPVNLRVTRDDDAVRQIDVFTVGPIKIDLLPEERAAKLHRAVLRLRAPDPTWYDPVPGTASVTGSATFAQDWWLAGGAIGTAQVLMHGTVPGSAEAWSYAGTIRPLNSTDQSQTWTLAVRNAGTPIPGATSFMFLVGTATTAGTPYVIQASAQVLPDGTQKAGTTLYPSIYDPLTPNLGATIRSGTHNYFMTFFADPGAGGIHWHTGGTQYTYNVGMAIEGTARLWRSGGWTPAIERYALYNPKLSDAQRNALDIAMAFGSDPTDLGTINTYINVAYEGNMPDYPVISITGPISSPIILNAATWMPLNFGTVTIGAGTTYVIDTRYGYKTVTEGTVNKRNELSDDSNLEAFALVPDPIAPNGANQLMVYGDDINSNTEISVVYYKRYASY